jgi:hypothetical protein
VRKFCGRIDWMSLLIVFMIVLVLLVVVISMGRAAEGEAMSLTTIWNGGRPLPEISKHETAPSGLASCGVLEEHSIECLYDKDMPAQGVLEVKK